MQINQDTMMPRHAAAGPILVFGATGRQGGAVVAALRAAGWPVRALVRDPASEAARHLASRGAELVRGDLSDDASMRAAMAGAHGVFSVQPNSGSAGSGITDADEMRFGMRVADIAAESGVRHLVYSSAGIVSQGRTGMDNLDVKLDIEAHVRGVDIPSTIVRPATFMDLLVLPGMGLDAGVFSFFLHPQQSAQFIAVEDIGRVVARVFADVNCFAGRTIELAGDEMTGYGLQEALTQAAGRPVAYQRFSEALLDQQPMLRRNAVLFDEGRATGNADIATLSCEFGSLLRVRDWLAGPGRQRLAAALVASGRPVALR